VGNEILHFVQNDKLEGEPMTLDKAKRMHFVGIGGAGMSAIAWVLLKQGFQISGSDLGENTMIHRLRKHGARIFFGHVEENVAEADILVVSSAIRHDNPELVAARDRGMPIMHRAEVLAEILNTGYGIAICGTHGKTTTTSMTALLLERAGLDPTILIGGEVNDIGGNAKLGSSHYVVAEADESDGSFLHFHPQCAIVTNIEAEHLDYYRDFEAILATFQQFLSQIKPGGTAILCQDDMGVRMLIPSVSATVLTYSLRDRNATLFAADVVLQSASSTFRVLYKGEPFGEIQLGVPGQHNVYNALAAIGVGVSLGIPLEPIQEAMSLFRGAKRRFETKGIAHGVTVVDDYAHHPSEVVAAINIAALRKREKSGRIIAIFQPHRYTRTLHLGKAFGAAFSTADVVIVTDVYSAGEEPIQGVSGRIVYESVSQSGHPNVTYIQSKDEICERVLEELERGDLLVTLGAGDIWKVGEEVLRRLRLEPITNSPAP
jgi:UDP-N-acetylmuramate--alanine ligase